MAGSGGALNLSLLSRGVGEVTKNGHEKVEVLFEPQDYYNFLDSTQRLYLPPIKPQYAFGSPSFTTRRPYAKPQVAIPKTFTTRKGALLLFSEDLAQRTKAGHVVRRHHTNPDHLGSISENVSPLAHSVDESDLRTVEDLTKSILCYGNQENDDPNGTFKFIHGRKKRDYFDRQIRPGFSAKRYLSSWTKCWDDSVLEKVIRKGYLTEKSLFYYNPLMPHVQRRLNDDMSHYPVPYKLMRSMLMSPGSLSGYTFYKVRPESAESILTQEAERGTGALSQGASIKIISTKDGIQKEVTYASLDQKAKEEVLTDLLVKSAVHYAMKKQQQIEDSYKAIEENKIKEVSEESKSSIPQFDMKEAVESLLDNHKGKALLDADFADDKSQYSDTSGSFKGKAKKSKKSKSRSGAVSPGSGRFVSGAAVVSIQEGAESPSSIPTLPQIPGGQPVLPPIGEASREQSKAPITLPPIAKDELDDAESWGPEEQELARARILEGQQSHREEVKYRKKKLGEGPMVAGGSYLQSSTESITSVHSIPAHKLQRTQFKGSNRNLASKRGAGSSLEGSSKGSVVLGPDGEVIPLGGKIQITPRPEAAPNIEQVVNANQADQPAGTQIGKDLISDDSDAEEPDEWKHSKPLRKSDSMRNFATKRAPLRLPVLESLPSQISEQDIVEALADHASQIATDILQKSDAGHDLTEDAKHAAEMWMAKFPPGRRLSRSMSIQELPDTLAWLMYTWQELEFLSAIDSVMKKKLKSAGPNYVEYRDLIKKNLTTAISNASGEEIPANFTPQDAEISTELIEALASESLTPEDIEIVQDEETGKSLIRSKSQMSQALGGVKEGHIYVPGSNKENEIQTVVSEGKRSAVTFKDEEEPVDEFKEAVDKLQQESEDQKSVVSKKSDEEASEAGTAKTVKSAKSLVSQKSEEKSKVSDESATKSKTPEKKEEFVVGKPKEKKGKAAPAKKGAKGKKGKAAKKKEEEKPEPEAAPKEPTPPPKEPTPPPPEEPKVDYEQERESVADSYKTDKTEEEEDFEFNIVREEDSPSPDPIGNQSIPDSSVPSVVDDTTEAEEDYEEDVSNLYINNIPVYFVGSFNFFDLKYNKNVDDRLQKECYEYAFRKINVGDLLGGKHI